MNKKNTRKLKHQIGLLLIVGLLIAAIVYAFMGKSNKVYAPATTSEESSMSCGITPGAKPGCAVPTASAAVARTPANVAIDEKVLDSGSAENKKIIAMTYDSTGLTPTTIEMKQGKSYTILIDVKTTVNGCMNTINIPGLDENMQNVNKGSTLVFHVNPTTAGTYEFKCAMGLSHGAKIIVK